MGIVSLIKDYQKGNLQGWAGEDVAKSEWNLLKSSSSFRKFQLQMKVGASRRMMLFDVTRSVLGKDTENYPQEIGDCYVADTKVLMADGTEKNIQDIKIGEYVINHKNEQAKVTDLVKKKFTGNLVTIKVKGWSRKITATETHDALYMPKTKARFKFEGFEKKKFGDYEVGDYIILPFGASVQEFSKIYSPDFEKSFEVNEDFCRFVGLYLAEGGVTNNTKITFNFCLDEEDFADEICKLSEKLFGKAGVKYYHKREQNVLLVDIHSAKLARFIKEIIPGNTYTKVVPECVFKTSKEAKLACLKGWLDGDGHKYKQHNRINGVSVSEELVNGMSTLAKACGLNPKTKVSKSENKKDCYRLDLYSLDCKKIYPDFEYRKDAREIVINDTPYGFARTISSIEKDFVEDYPVYCITTEKEYTIIANGIGQYQCVSFGMKNAIEYLQCCEILLTKDPEEFHNIFPPYLYGTGRIYIGRGQLGNEDGSLGSWMADAVIKYGTINSDAEGCPRYAGSVAKSWGGPNGKSYLDKWAPLGKQHLVKSAAKISNWDQLVAAICNGYPVTIASMQGFNMKPDSRGFHQASGEWSHQMCVIGVDDEYADPYCIILNSWGDAHGVLKDFTTGKELPVGTLRVKKSVINYMLSSGEGFAISNFDGFRGQNEKIEKALFKLN